MIEKITSGISTLWHGSLYKAENIDDLVKHRSELEVTPEWAPLNPAKGYRGLAGVYLPEGLCLTTSRVNAELLSQVYDTEVALKKREYHDGHFNARALSGDPEQKLKAELLRLKNEYQRHHLNGTLADNSNRIDIYVPAHHFLPSDIRLENILVLVNPDNNYCGLVSFDRLIKKREVALAGSGIFDSLKRLFPAPAYAPIRN